jgi:hypothetical protein
VTRLQELEGAAANVAAEAPASGWLDEVPTFKQVRRKSIRVTFLQVGARMQLWYVYLELCVRIQHCTIT